MGFLLNLYKSTVADKQFGNEAIPMIDPIVLALKCEENSFTNSKGLRVKYYFYHKDIKFKEKIVLFCHGISGKGHRAYIREIDELCKHGYRVLTLDYTGCGESEGDKLESMVIPTRDTNELLEYLKLKEQVIAVGHSMGGFTVLNLAYLRDDINKVVALSPFISVYDQMRFLLKSALLAKGVVKYEKKTVPEYASIDLHAFLKQTTKDIMILQSDDDPICSYKYTLQKIESYNNPHIVTISYQGKKHNVNYTFEALDYMNQSIGTYRYLIKKKQLKTLDEQIEYFKDKSPLDMTTQDEKVWKSIFAFID